jgi:hypothetical protein
LYPVLISAGSHITAQLSALLSADNKFKAENKAFENNNAENEQA